MRSEDSTSVGATLQRSAFAEPALANTRLPAGGGAIRGIDEQLAVNPTTATATFSVPIPASAGRDGFGPTLTLAYDSGAGNGPFGIGWSAGIPAISRRTDKGIPQYADEAESDLFIGVGGDELVRVLVPGPGGVVPDIEDRVRSDGSLWRVTRYRPRIEGGFSRIERWTRVLDGETFWQVVTGENVTTRYGLTPKARIADPADPLRRTFTWLASESFDDKGNAIVYDYVGEDDAGVDTSAGEEHQRSSADRAANRYLKSIRYGNPTPIVAGDAIPQRDDWLFQIVFDYGDHDAAKPTPSRDTAWPVRADAFSNRRAGFEIRNYRLCKRILMFHNFPGETIGAGCLVWSLAFGYDEQPVVTRLASLRRHGYIRNDDGSYRERMIPPVAFTYSSGTIAAAVREVDPASLDGLPSGVDGAAARWIDLDGQGMPGVVIETGQAMWYKANLGDSRLAPPELLISRPSLFHQRDRRQALLDLEGDGSIELVAFDGPLVGFQRRTDSGCWGDFRGFASTPNISWDDPNLRFVDLTGDGRPDILIVGDEVFTWYESLGEQGFAPPRTATQTSDEQLGPRLVFADATQSVYLADMTGDGLADLVRINNGSVWYWPGLGYGRFGPAVQMANPPVFDRADLFAQNRIRLADVDGSGPADIVYLGPSGAVVYANESGNRWSAGQTIVAFPPTDDLTDVSVVDLLGNGTACLVWSSPLPGDGRRRLRFVELTGGEKPHLLVGIDNNMGGEWRIEYTASTVFYLADRARGQPWQTRLPFPVQCVSKTESIDRVTGLRFSSEFVYAHGHYDSREREFCGFARVDRFDTDNFDSFVLAGAANAVDAAFHQPPVLTRSWYYLGQVPITADRIRPFAAEYYQGAQAFERGLSAFEPEWDVAVDELAEAARACKGLMLRTEVYSPDGAAAHPYAVSESGYTVRRIQPHGPNRYAVFQTLPRESIDYHLERDPTDPRIAQSLILATDPKFGHVTASVAVSYGRKTTDASLSARTQAAQAATHLSLTETDYTTSLAAAAAEAYRLPQPYEMRGYELRGLPAPADGWFTIAGLDAVLAGAPRVAFDAPPSGLPEYRLLHREHRRFLADDLAGPLAAGILGGLGLTHRNYKLALTPSLVTSLYGGRIGDADLTAAGYVHLSGDLNWWVPSATLEYPLDPAAHFYRPTGLRDVFGNRSSVGFDPYGLLPVTMTDAVGNGTSFVNDYRLLRARQTTDANQNRSSVEMDELGFVVASALMGKLGAGEGDMLADPTARFTYDLEAYWLNRKPISVHSFVREEHGAANPRWQESYTYTGGLGHVAMVKVQAEPGLALRIDPDTDTLEEIDTGTDLRWVGTGRVVLDNKGNAVRRYDPYFSTTPDYETDPRLVETGHTSVLFYDPLGRVIRTEDPDGTFTKVTFDSWQSRSYDALDTVLESKWYADRGSPDPVTEPEPSDPDRRSAWLAAKLANTPSRSHVDSLGQVVATVADNGSRGLVSTEVVRDLSGSETRFFDTMGREVGALLTDMAGTTCRSEGAEKGTHWSLQAVDGQPFLAFDAQGRRYRFVHDVGRRLVETWMLEHPADEMMVGYTLYGDLYPDAIQRNIRGRAAIAYDQSGAVRVDSCDFRGRPLHVERRYAGNYKTTVDWKPLSGLATAAAVRAAAEPLLEIETFASDVTVDALGRPKSMTLAEGSVVVPGFNPANGLSQLSIQLSGMGSLTPIVTEEHRNARGERLSVAFGNGSSESYDYDPHSRRLTRAQLVRAADGAILRDARYVYDSAGHITTVTDAAQQTLYFDNSVVPAAWNFEYDALAQLIVASGREQANGAPGVQPDSTDAPVNHLPHANDASAVRVYQEKYDYDALGNLQSMRHIAGAGSWTRRYRYAYQVTPGDLTNRLAATSAFGDPANVYSLTYTYDAGGNMASMPHLASMVWNAFDQLRSVDLGGGGTAYYVYGAGGVRVRKVIERKGGLVEERRYLGAVEYHRRSLKGVPTFERRTIRLTDGSGEVTRIDTKVLDADDASGLNIPVFRYVHRCHNHSSMLELDESAALISCEEYHPFGTTAYRSGRSEAETSLKRYRFAMKERDDETGLYYFGARYYAAWLGRWTSADPSGFADGFNVFVYVHNNPVAGYDPDGRADKTSKPKSTNAAGGKMGARGIVSWKGPAKQDTAEDIEKWATQQGIVYTEKPTKQADGKWWIGDVTYTTKGKGGLAAPAAGGTGTPASAAPPIPQRGDFGSSLPHDQHPPAEYRDPTNAATRMTENEHIMPGASLEAVTKNPKTGVSDYTDKAYGKDNTTRVERPMALDKTAGGPGRDNPRSAALHNKVDNGQSINYREEVFEDSRQNAIRAARATNSAVTEENINTGILQQEGNLFNTFRGGQATQRLPAQSFGQRIAEGARNVAARIVYTKEGYNRFSTGGAALARGLIPGFVEAEIGAIAAPYAVVSLGITNTTIIGAAGAMAAAPTATASVVAASAAAGYIVGGTIGHAVEDATNSKAAGVAAGTLSGAATGAAIGFAIGSVVPVLGNGVGAVIGGVVGGIAGFIGSYW